MKKLISVGICFLLCVSCHTNKRLVNTNEGLEKIDIYPKGEKITNNNFVGNAWLYQMVQSDSLNHISVGSVTFDPGARTNWHYHPAGQILLAVDGVGYYQEQGSPKKILRKGDVVNCPPNIPHWHGSSQDTAFVQIAITNAMNGPTVWMQTVTEDEYNANKN